MTIPDVGTLIQEVVSRSPNSASVMHGEPHWRAVAVTGLFLLEETAADDEVVFLFALLHDSKRFHDGLDPDHGRRAARLAHKLRGDFYSISDAQMDTLEEALIEHDHGHTSVDLTIGTCWDSDRLQLWRTGRKPHPRYLSTPAAAKRIEWARDARLERVSWQAIIEAYGLIREEEMVEQTVR